MMNKRVEEAFNKHVNAEMWSAQLYLSMAAWCSGKGLNGIANWMFVQHREEAAHALKFFNYILQRNGHAVLEPIEAVPVEWNNVLNVFEETMQHEMMVSGLINELVSVASEQKDHATVSMLQWFVNEQVEEESNVQAILDQLRLIGSEGNGLFILDREMKSRVFVDPLANPVA